MCVYITLQDADRQFVKVPEGFTGKFLAADELHALATTGEYEISREFLSGALEKGDECYALLQGSHVAAFGWYSRLATAVNDELTLHFDPAYVYMYFGYTHPDYRGKRLHAFGMTHALRDYTERGYQGMVSFGCRATTLHRCGPAKEWDTKKRDASIRPGSAESIGYAQARGAMRSDFDSFPTTFPAGQLVLLRCPNS